MDAADSAQALLAEAFSYYRREDYDTARELLERAIEIEPSWPELHHRLGLVCERLGDLAGAADAYAGTLELDSENVDVLTSLALVQLQRGRSDDADTLSAKAVGLAPDDDGTQMSRGCILSELERFEEAEGFLKRAVVLAPDYEWNWVNLGILYERWGKYELAIEPCEKAMELEPDNAYLVTVMARLLYRLDDLEGAENEARRSLELNPEDDEAMFILAKVLYHEDEDEEAAEWMEKAVELDPHDSAYRYTLGEIQLSLGNFEEARYHLAKAVLYDPDYEDAAELLDQVEMRTAAGDPKTSIFVHDRREQLMSMIRYAGDVLWRLLALAEPTSTHVTMRTVGGKTDQTHYVVLGVIVYAEGIKKEEVEEAMRDIAKGWTNPIEVRASEHGVEIEVLARGRDGAE